MNNIDYDDYEYYNERAAILEFDAGYSRSEAEHLAGGEMVQRRQSIEDKNREWNSKWK